MAIFWSSINGQPVFYSEESHGARTLTLPQSEKEIRAGKRAKSVPNPDSRIPADAVPISDEEHARLIAAQDGNAVLRVVNGAIVALDAAADSAARIAATRVRRDRALAASDWTQLPDTTLSSEAVAAWAAYRQALRDLDLAAGVLPAAPGAA